MKLFVHRLCPVFAETLVIPFRQRSNLVSHEFVAAKILRERGAVASSVAAGGVEDEYNDGAPYRSTL